MEMARLFLTRHGQTNWNIEKRMQGRADSELTQQGYEAAFNLGNRLNNVDIDVIISSPSPRAVRTAEVLRGKRKLDIALDEHFLEMDVGNWEGLKESKIKQMFPQNYRLFWEQPHLYKSEKGEDFYQVHERVFPRFKRLVEEYTDQNILIVTHSVVLKILMAHFERRPMEKLWEGPYIYSTSLSIVDVKDDSYEIVQYADTSHITDSAFS